MVNDPSAADKYWSVEIAFPIQHLIYNTTASKPKNGTFWHINFSRVEWRVQVVNNTFVKVPNVPEDNWVLAPTYVVNIHLPEFWANLQFSTDNVNQTQPIWDPEVVLLSVCRIVHHDL